MNAGTDRPAPITVLDFRADWCGTCRMVEPVLARIVSGQADVELHVVDVERDATMAERYGVHSLPTLIFVTASGCEMVRLSGTVNGKQISQAIADARSSPA